MVTGNYPLVQRNNVFFVDEWVLGSMKVATQLYPKMKVFFHFLAGEDLKDN